MDRQHDWRRYKVMGHGRRVGAIGVMEGFTIYLRAFDREGASFAVYEFYEHISGLQVVEVDNDGKPVP